MTAQRTLMVSRVSLPRSLKTFNLNSILRSAHRQFQLTTSVQVQGLGNFTHTYLCTRRTQKGFKCTVVNWAFLPLHGGSIEITLTGPLTFYSFLILPLQMSRSGYPENSGMRCIDSPTECSETHTPYCSPLWSSAQ